MAKRIREMEALGAAEIIVAHAYDAPASGMLARAMSGDVAIDDYVRSEGRSASEQLSRFLGEAGLASARHVSVPVKGTPARTIIECAKDESASLIVVGTSRRKGIERMFLGSVAEDVLANADRDVLVVPA